MNILHCLDNRNLGGIQEYILLLHKNDRHNKHDFWAAPGSMDKYLREANMVLWDGGPSPEAHYDVIAGHTVGGWSYKDTFNWARARGAKTIEVMHSNCKSPTPPDLVDGFVALNRIAHDLNPQMRNRRVIYGIVEVDKFYEGERKYIGRLSRLVDEKRPQDFLELARRFPSRQFRMAGDGPLMASLFSSASANLALVGMVRDFPAFYSQLQAFVFPTRDECNCISVAMAQAAGVPCVVQDIAPLRETTGGYALFANSFGEFESGLTTLLQDEALRQKLSEQGREWARAHFSPEVVCGQWDELLNANL